MRSLLPWHHPQTSLNELLHTAHRGGAGLWKHILALRSTNSLYLGLRKQKGIQGKQFIWQSRKSLDATFSALSQIA